MTKQKYKSDVFSMLMEDPNNALNLYYVNGSNLQIRNGRSMQVDEISLSVRNDRHLYWICD